MPISIWVVGPPTWVGPTSSIGSAPGGTSARPEKTRRRVGWSYFVCFLLVRVINVPRAPGSARAIPWQAPFPRHNRCRGPCSKKCPATPVSGPACENEYMSSVILVPLACPTYCHYHIKSYLIAHLLRPQRETK